VHRNPQRCNRNGARQIHNQRATDSAVSVAGLTGDEDFLRCGSHRRALDKQLGCLNGPEQLDKTLGIQLEGFEEGEPSSFTCDIPSGRQRNKENERRPSSKTNKRQQNKAMVNLTEQLQLFSNLKDTGKEQSNDNEEKSVGMFGPGAKEVAKNKKARKKARRKANKRARKANKNVRKANKKAHRAEGRGSKKAMPNGELICEIWFRHTKKKAAQAMSIMHITQIVSAFYEKEFVYERDYDGNGIVHWVGTMYGEEEWKNPSERGLINVESSKWANGSVEAMVANKACNAYSASASINRRVNRKTHREHSWASVEFVGGVMVRPTKYTLSHRTGSASHYLRSWVFEGSCDGVEGSRDGVKWTLIREHLNDESLNGAGESHSWDTINVDGCFNRFRVRMTGQNSWGNFSLNAHALEIYGFVRR